ncbi:MAG: nuclear transport factor 2 family protein [Woeseiaceae bacterium]|nr:nuclear transport factor 2 family protein [Woeseiaceae bacterium]
MSRLLTVLATLLIASPTLADNHGGAEAAVRDAVRAFNAAYAENRVDDYFGYYADGADVYFYGARQDLSAYYDAWKAGIEAGGGVEKNDLSDVRIRVLPGGEAVVASYFVDFRSRTPDGEIEEARAFESEVWQRIDDRWQIVSLHFSEIPPEE